MNLLTTVLGVAILLAFVPIARAADTSTTGAVNVPANRIVGSLFAPRPFGHRRVPARVTLGK